MKLVERTILGLLFDSAAQDGFYCDRFAPNSGMPGDEITLSAPPGLCAAQCIQEADVYDSASVAEFVDGEGRRFWILLIWGNGEDVVSDYSGGKPYADAVVERVYKQIEGP